MSSKKNFGAQKMHVIMLGLFLITSSGIVAGSGVPWNVSLPMNGIQGGQTFFSLPISSPYGSAGVTTPSIPTVLLQTISTSQSQAGESFVFVRQGDTYAIFPQSSEEPIQYPVLAQTLQMWCDPHRKRSRFRTHVEILELLKNGPLSAFEVAFQLRLNSKRTKEYLEFLEQQELVELGEGKRALYRITPKGMASVEMARAFLFLDN